MGYWLRGMFADDGENRSGDDGKTTTRLGFGCSSLMGALGRKESLAMLEAAFDAGIRHFDVAPMYGFGQAESCLGQFLGRHRAEVTVTTKYGIPPAKNQGWIAAARAASRPVIKAIPGLKRGLKTVAEQGGGAGRKSELHGDGGAAIAGAEPARVANGPHRRVAAARGHAWMICTMLHCCACCGTRSQRVRSEPSEWAANGRGLKRCWPRVRSIAPRCSSNGRCWTLRCAQCRSFRIHHRALTENVGGLQVQLAREKKRCAEWSDEVGRRPGRSWRAGGVDAEGGAR